MQSNAPKQILRFDTANVFDINDKDHFHLRDTPIGINQDGTIRE